MEIDSNMARVSLVLVNVRGTLTDVRPIDAARRSLEAAGHGVEVLVASGPGVSEPAQGVGRWLPCLDRGRVAAAVHGLLQASGDYVLVVDPSQGYPPEDLVRVLTALVEGRAVLAVGCRWSDGPGVARVGRLRSRIGDGLRRVFGSSDPFSGLIGLNRDALNAASPGFRAVGSQFALELLGRVQGTRIDVPARPAGALMRAWPGFDDLRHLKRLADDRYGNISRLLQFCVVGASGMVIDLSAYALFQWVFARTWLAGKVAPIVGSVDLAVSAVLAIALALTWNFSLNRRLTFNDARSGSIVRQYITYALSNALAISVNLTLRLWLPEVVPYFDRHKLVAAVVGIVLATGLSFSMSRWLVFQRQPRPVLGGPEPVLSESTLAP
jgi:dolichol-phosphate mannosyltransferase